MAISNNVLNSSIVQSILSPALKLNDTTTGVKGNHAINLHEEYNRKVLLNRVKKLIQSDRRELVETLDEVIKNIGPTIVPGDVPPLKERGISTLILADDGTLEGQPGLLISFFLGVFNRYGSRISSAVIMQKIQQTRQLLIERGYPELSNDVNPEVWFNWQIAQLESRIGAQNPAHQIRPLIEEIATLWEKFSILSQQNWTINTFYDFLNSLRNFKTKTNGKVPSEIQTEINRAIEMCTKIIQIVTQGSTMQETAQKLQRDILPDLNLLVPAGQLEKWKEEINALAQGKRIEGKNFEYWKRTLFIPMIHAGLLSASHRSETVMNLFNVEIAEAQKEKDLIQQRQQRYRVNVQKTAYKAQLQAVQRAIKTTDTQLKNLKKICGYIDYVHERKDRSFSEIKSSLNWVYSNFCKSSNLTLRGTGYFEQHLTLLTRYANGDLTLNVQELANLLDLSILNGGPEQELCNRLSVFKLNPQWYADEYKKLFVNDYIAYLKFVFETWTLRAEENLRSQKEISVQLQGALNLSSIPVSPGVSIPSTNSTVVGVPPRNLAVGNVPPGNSAVVGLPLGNPVVVNVPTTHLIPVVAQNDGLPPMLPIPSADGSNPVSLLNMATGIQNNRSSSSAAAVYYGQFDGTVPKPLADLVYGNFYWIMKDAGLLGPTNADGHSQDHHWGKNVFTTGRSSQGNEPSISSPLLNHYRTQAIVEVLAKKYRNHDHQIF